MRSRMRSRRSLKLTPDLPVERYRLRRRRETEQVAAL
jgi:hypothetical protein